MNTPRDNGPTCRNCGKALSINRLSGSYECLACTFRAMNEQQVVEVGEPRQAHRYEPDSDYLEVVRIKEFQRHLHRSAPKLIVTKALVALNILVFLYVSWKGGRINSPSSDLLLELGANHGGKIFSGEWWRLFTSMFLHGGLTHLAFNMYALWIIGSIVEKLFGWFGYTVIYFVAGVGGSMLSLYNHSANTVGVGASGAVFGIFGALVSYAYFKRMPRVIASGILKNAAFMIVLNLAIGLSIPQIDNSAHIGGCITGLIVAFFIGQDLSKVNERKRTLVSLTVVGVFLVLVSSAWNFVGAKNSVNKSEIEKNEEIIKKFGEYEDLKEAEFKALLRQYHNGDLQATELAAKIEEEYIAFFQIEGDKLIKGLDNKFVAPQFKKYTKKYVALYKEYWQNIKKYVETKEPSFLERAGELKKRLANMRLDDFK